MVLAVGGWILERLLGCRMKLFVEAAGEAVGRSLWVCRRGFGGWIERVLVEVEGRRPLLCSWIVRSGRGMPLLWFEEN